MGRLRLVSACLGVAIVLGSSAGATPSPSLRVASTSPVVVRGLHFKPREVVVVTLVRGGDRRSRRSRSSSTGRLRVAFDGVVVDRCDAALYLRAVGARGSRASFKLPRLQCPPALLAP